MKSKMKSESAVNAELQKTCCAADSSVVAGVSAPETEVDELNYVESEVGPEAIRELAYCKWQAAGCPCGNDIGFWLEAERELRRET